MMDFLPGYFSAHKLSLQLDIKPTLKKLNTLITYLQKNDTNYNLILFFKRKRYRTF